MRLNEALANELRELGAEESNSERFAKLIAGNFFPLLIAVCASLVTYSTFGWMLANKGRTSVAWLVIMGACTGTFVAVKAAGHMYNRLRLLALLAEVRQDGASNRASLTGENPVAVVGIKK